MVAKISQNAAFAVFIKIKRYLELQDELHWILCSDLGGRATPQCKGDWIMKKLLLSGVTLAALAVGPALAADLPRKAPPAPPPPPVLSWTGWYVGLNAGAVWGCGSASNTVTPASSDPRWPHGFPITQFAEHDRHVAAVSAATSFDLDNGCRDANFIGGGQIGYNWQFTGWVVGIEADFQGIGGNNNNGTRSQSAFAAEGPAYAPGSNWVGTATFERDNTWLGTLRARAGFLATPAFLIYATGGLAYGKTSGNLTLDIRNDVFCCDHIPAVTGFFDSDKSRAGWTVGGGVEWMFAPRWSLKAEYLYYDLGSRDLDFAFTIHDNLSNQNATFNSHTNVDFKGSIARVGVNYHFGGPGLY
jgi:outer membrane immunogenic protein